MMKKFLFVQLFILSFLYAGAQDLGSLVKAAANERVDSDFSFELNYNGAKFTGNGSFTLQDSCFVLKTESLELYSDSKTLWIVDKDAEEIYIQSATGLDLDSVLNSFDIEYKLITVKKSAKSQNTSPFTPDMKKYSADYVITDLT